MLLSKAQSKCWLCQRGSGEKKFLADKPKVLHYLHKYVFNNLDAG